jgi:Radical SAM superfamily/Iron-sulfur cluster-binding domain
MFGLTALKNWRKKRRKTTAKKPDARSMRDWDGNLNQKKDLAGYFCPHPFEQMDIYSSGSAVSCCAGWLRLEMGNVKDTAPDKLWNSAASQAVRQSVHDGTFQYCDQQVCPLIQGNILETNEKSRQNPKFREIIDNKITVMEEAPTLINFCNDKSCNLSCPSCRTEKILLSSGPKYEEKKAIHQTVIDAYLSKATDRAFTINVTGSGDPFASKIFREFLFDIKGSDFPNMRINLQTNGVMLTPRYFVRLKKIYANLQCLIISLDAANAETYAITRRGGDWELLQENLAFLGKRRAEGYFDFMRLDFVVQADNFEDMPAYVKLAKRYGPDEIYFSMVTDWGTWPKDVFESKCIWKENHPRFRDFIDMMKDPIFDDPKVVLGNVTAYRERALNAA